MSSEQPNGHEQLTQELTFWYPQDTPEYGNMLGYCKHVVATPSDITHLTQVMERPFDPDTNVTRIMSISIITKDLLANATPELKALLDTHLEALMPLKGCGIQALDDCYSLYLAKNDLSRATPAQIETLQAKMKSAAQIFDTADAKTATKPQEDYKVIVLTPDAPSDIITQYAELITGDLPESDEEVRKDLENSEDRSYCVATVVQQDGHDRVVGAAQAFPDPFTVSWNGMTYTLNQYEIVAGVTHPDVRGKGFYHVTLEGLHTALAEAVQNAQKQGTETPIHMVTAFSNLGQPGVLKAARRDGRTSTISAGRELGLLPKGFLHHAKLQEEDPEHADYLLTYMPQDELLKRYGKKN